MAGSKTLTGQIVVAALPASFEFAESSFGSVNAQVGQFVTVSAPVTNIGGTAGAPAIEVGTTSLNGTVEGHWLLYGNIPTIAPGATEQVEFSTDQAIAAMFGGDTLQVSIALQ